ncbi:SH3 domain-containing protein [Cognatiyoonia sp. IB215446]|uniref:SH3 domain-containing protein n=1 Tax=Cognatiyoonia sp. IB215446 TaxID=3097355 RepID=UPI002A0F9EEC|nr:SH3 domain-containing protein [Cognatiyoonia sp. IB215446]MDX8350284.1 SH3 domain-containing protein [Cognatiyoonia sp. IB215446]
MPNYIVVTTLFLFWAFYEMSGGADFEPPERIEPVAVAIVAPIETPEPIVAEAPEPEATVTAEIMLASYEDEPLAISSVVPDTALETVASPAFVAPEPVDIRLVSGEWVNMRDGPSTDYRVLDTLPRGTEAEVLDVNGAGWAQIRLVDTGQMGWMAERLLSTD